jgi:hypothetical protein
MVWRAPALPIMAPRRRRQLDVQFLLGRGARLGFVPLRNRYVAGTESLEG